MEYGIILSSIKNSWLYLGGYRLFIWQHKYTSLSNGKCNMYMYKQFNRGYKFIIHNEQHDSQFYIVYEYIVVIWCLIIIAAMYTYVSVLVSLY